MTMMIIIIIVLAGLLARWQS